MVENRRDALAALSRTRCRVASAASATMCSMRRRTARRGAGQEERPDQPVLPRPSTGWAALLGVLVVVLGAAAAIVDKQASLRWLWSALLLAGAVVGASATLLSSAWWQNRQAARRAEDEVAAVRARERARDQRDYFGPRGPGVLPFGGRRGWYFTGRVRALQELAGWLAPPPVPSP
jgi:hypothetical protein